MAISIENNYKLVNDLLTKNNGAYLTPDSYNRYAELASNDLFKKKTGLSPNKQSTYGLDRKLDRQLRVFREVIPKDVVDGKVKVPQELKLITAIYTDTDKPVPFKEIDEDRFARIFHDPLASPIESDPMFKEDSSDDSARIYPESITKVIFEGLRLPTKAEYKYTVQNRRPVFDKINSVDFEWDNTFETELTIRILQYAGISLEDSQIVQITEAKKDKE